MPSNTNPPRYCIHQPGAVGILLRGSLPGLDRDVHLEINAYGLRGRLDRATDTLRVLILGGSTVEDNLLNDDDTWCGRLEYRLGAGAWVGNMGRAGCYSHHHVLQIARCLPSLPKPDAVLLLCGLNDMLYAAGAHEDGYPSEQLAFGMAPGGPVHVLSTGGVPLGDMIQGFKRRRRAVGRRDWRPYGPVLDTALGTYRENLRQIIASARQRSVARIALITQPALWKPDMRRAELAHLYAGGLGSPAHWSNPATPWYTPDALRAMLDVFNQTMRQVAAEQGVALIDLARELEPKVEHYLDDFHFSKLGADRVAVIVKAGLDRAGIRVAPMKAPMSAPSDKIYPLW